MILLFKIVEEVCVSVLSLFYDRKYIDRALGRDDQSKK